MHGFKLVQEQQPQEQSTDGSSASGSTEAAGREEAAACGQAPTPPASQLDAVHAMLRQMAAAKLAAPFNAEQMDPKQALMVQLAEAVLRRAGNGTAPEPPSPAQRQPIPSAAAEAVGMLTDVDSQVAAAQDQETDVAAAEAVLHACCDGKQLEAMAALLGVCRAQGRALKTMQRRLEALETRLARLEPH